MYGSSAECFGNHKALLVYSQFHVEDDSLEKVMKHHYIQSVIENYFLQKGWFVSSDPFIPL